LLIVYGCTRRAAVTAATCAGKGTPRKAREDEVAREKEVTSGHGQDAVTVPGGG